jgi:hypothetical protein
MAEQHASPRKPLPNYAFYRAQGNANAMLSYIRESISMQVPIVVSRAKSPSPSPRSLQTISATARRPPQQLWVHTGALYCAVDARSQPPRAAPAVG